MKSVVLSASLCIIALSACAGREPNLPNVALSNDSKLECDALSSEVLANANSAKAKISSNQARDGGDIAIGIAGGLLFWPALFAIDTKNADGHEGNALLDRNEHLKTIALSKGCDVTAYPTVARYE